MEARHVNEQSYLTTVANGESKWPQTGVTYLAHMFLQTSAAARENMTTPFSQFASLLALMPTTVTPVVIWQICCSPFHSTVALADDRGNLVLTRHHSFTSIERHSSHNKSQDTC